jgi:hypothetical protein
MRPTKLTTETLGRSSATDFNAPFYQVGHSHRAVEWPDVIERVRKGVNQREWRIGKERSGYGSRGSEPGSLLSSELYFDLGHGRLNFRKDKASPRRKMSMRLGKH